MAGIYLKCCALELRERKQVVMCLCWVEGEEVEGSLKGEEEEEEESEKRRAFCRRLE